MSLNGEKVSTTNANFAHKCFIETEFLHGNDAKAHGLLVKAIIMTITHRVMLLLIGGELKMSRKHKQIVAASSNFLLFGKIACDFLSCDKHLISGDTIRLSLR